MAHKTLPPFEEWDLPYLARHTGLVATDATGSDDDAVASHAPDRSKRSRPNSGSAGPAVGTMATAHGLPFRVSDFPGYEPRRGAGKNAVRHQQTMAMAATMGLALAASYRPSSFHAQMPDYTCLREVRQMPL